MRPARSPSKAIQKQSKYEQLEMTDRRLIEMGAQELAARHGFSDVKKMRQRDFEWLCARIEETSGILISLSTIKRIMNGQFNRLPQVATLNALSVCLGYTGWQDFKAAKQQPAIKPGSETALPPPTAEQPTPPRPAAEQPASPQPAAKQPTPSPPAAEQPTPPQPAAKQPARYFSWRPSLPVICAGIFAILLILLLSWNYFSSSPTRDGSNATFAVRKTTQNAVPNTVVFTYDIDHLNGDSFFIQQSWDRHRRVRIYKNKHTLTDIYYEPGYHTAKLIVNDRIVKTIGVSIPTDKWFFYSKESLSQGLPNYIRPAEPIHNGIIGLEKQDLIDNRIDAQKPQWYLYTYFPSIMEAEGDNFKLKARIRMNELRNTACPIVMPEIFCQHNFMYFVSTIPGCTGSISAQFGDRLLDGKENDLSGLACDVHQWHDIEMLVKERQVSISIDGKEVMTNNYSGTAGLITGLGFHSNGLCEIDSVELKGLDGKMVYPPASSSLH